MRTLIAAVVTLALALSISGGAASAETGGNVGSERSISGTTYDHLGNLVTYTCAYVHRTRVSGGYLERQSCRLAEGSARPNTSIEIRYGPNSWASDYVLRVSGGRTWDIAAWWSQRIEPSGVSIITSFYPAR